MTSIPYNPTQVQQLRSAMILNGEKLSPTQAWGILRKTQDYDLALTALVMKPRPDWVADLLRGQRG